MHFAVGTSVKTSPSTTIAMDIKEVLWQDVNLIGEDPSNFGGYGWIDSTVFAIGIEHDWNENLTLRAGFNYGRSPIPNERVFANFLFPAISEEHLTIGGSYKFTNALELGLSAYWAPKVTQQDPGTADNFSQMGNGTILENEQYGSQVSLTYKF